MKNTQPLRRTLKYGFDPSPSTLAKLGLSWAALQRAHPQLSLIEIVGASAERAEEPGHDLTYLAEAGLVTGTALPPPCWPT